MPQSWTSYVNAIEDDNCTMCYNAATLDGHCPEDADECDNGELKCSTCPWKKEEE